jgi:hypothetical protein
VALLFKNSSNKIPSLSPHSVAMILPAESCTFYLFAIILPAVLI